MCKLAKWWLAVILLAGSAMASVELIAPDGKAEDLFGYSVAVSGNTLIVSTGILGENGMCCRGTIYVYQKAGNTTWYHPTLVAELTAADGSIFDSVAISGNTIVAGAMGATVNGTQYQGCAFVFVEPNGGWQTGNETAKLTASDGGFLNWFGTSVAIDKKTILVGSPGSGVSSQGQAYIFSQPLTGWTTGTETARLTSSNGQAGDWLGGSVSVNGPVAVAGAPSLSSTDTPHSGSVYVFQETVGGWQSMTETAELSENPAMPREQLGTAVVVQGGTIVAGAPATDTLSGEGRVMIYLEPVGGWQTTSSADAILTCLEFDTNGFGESVAINPKLILVGDPFALGFGGRGNPGSVFVFKKPVTGWASGTPTEEILYHQSGQLHTGWSVAAYFNNTAFAGSPWSQGAGRVPDKGSAFITLIP